MIIAIEGMSGSGKTTLSAELAAKYGDCAIIHIDDYYDCSVGRLKHEEICSEFQALKDKHKSVIVEGVYCLKFDFDYDLKVFMEIGKDEQRRRIRKRNPDLYERYVNEWIPAENKYFEEFNVKGKCDIVLDGAGGVVP